MANKHKESGSNIISHHGNTIKTTMKHYFTPVRVAFIERQEITNVGMEKRELLCTVGRNVNW